MFRENSFELSIRAPILGTQRPHDEQTLSQISMNVCWRSLDTLTLYLTKDGLRSHLMAWEEQRFCKNDILPSASSKHDNVGDVIWCQRITASGVCQSFHSIRRIKYLRIHRIRFVLVAAISDCIELLLWSTYAQCTQEKHLQSTPARDLLSWPLCEYLWALSSRSR